MTRKLISFDAAYIVMWHVTVFSCDAFVRELGSGGHAESFECRWVCLWATSSTS